LQHTGSSAHTHASQKKSSHPPLKCGKQQLLPPGGDVAVVVAVGVNPPGGVRVRVGLRLGVGVRVRVGDGPVAVRVTVAVGRPPDGAILVTNRTVGTAFSPCTGKPALGKSRESVRPTT
jgi:hypothetical protein